MSDIPFDQVPCRGYYTTRLGPNTNSNLTTLLREQNLDSTFGSMEPGGSRRVFIVILHNLS